MPKKARIFRAMLRRLQRRLPLPLWTTQVSEITKFILGQNSETEKSYRHGSTNDPAPDPITATRRKLSRSVV